MSLMHYCGIYEKAVPFVGWSDYFNVIKELGFSFIDLSIDETDERIARLDWNKKTILELYYISQENKCNINSICLSAHRKYPMGSLNTSTRDKSMEIMKKSLELASLLNISVIQLAGYDVYYEESNQKTKELFYNNLNNVLQWAKEYNIMLALENIDTIFLNTAQRYLEIFNMMDNHYFLKAYPDVGNFHAWGLDPVKELQDISPYIIGLHIKETKNAVLNKEIKFRDVSFGKGSVDFKKIFQALNQLDLNVPILIEMWTESAVDYKQEIRNSLEYLISQE